MRALRLIAFALVVALLAGCGNGAERPSGGLTPAFLGQQGITCDSQATLVRVRLHNSGASCAEAAAVVVLLSSGVKGPERIGGSNGQVSWICESDGSEAHSRRTRCQRGDRYFTAERVPP